MCLGTEASRRASHFASEISGGAFQIPFCVSVHAREEVQMAPALDFINRRQMSAEILTPRRVLIEDESPLRLRPVARTQSSNSHSEAFVKLQVYTLNPYALCSVLGRVERQCVGPLSTEISST